MREKRKTLKRKYINKKGGNNTLNTSDDVLYLLVSLIELKVLKIIDDESTNKNEELTIKVIDNHLFKNNISKLLNPNFNSDDDNEFNQVVQDKYKTHFSETPGK